MKTKNFPAKRLRRQLVVQGKDLAAEDSQTALIKARGKRSKIDRLDNTNKY